MTATIRKWGNSLALRLPKALADEFHLAPGSAVELRVVEGKLVVAPRRPPRYKLASLLKHVTKRNVHREVSDGGLVGREIF